MAVISSFLFLIFLLLFTSQKGFPLKWGLGDCEVQKMFFLVLKTLQSLNKFKLKNKILLFILVALFSCKETNQYHLQNYIAQDYLDEVCKRHINNWSINSDFQKLRILTKDSIKNQKIPYSAEILKSCILDKQFQQLLDDKIITQKDLNYFLHSKNNNFRTDFHSFNIHCKENIYFHNDGRDANTSFYSQPFYSEDKKVFIFKEGLNFLAKTDINLICVNKRICKIKIIKIASFYYSLPQLPIIKK